MRRTLKGSRSKVFSILTAVAMTICMTIPSIAVFAAEVSDDIPKEMTENAVITPFSGTETLPIGSYSIGNFTFTDTNLTPVKTVSGSKIALGISFRKAAGDAGLGNVKLTVQIRDTSGRALSPKWEYTANPNAVLTYVVTPEIDLGYSGRQIQIWFDASSAGQSNGNFRSIEVTHFNSFVS